MWYIGSVALWHVGSSSLDQGSNLRPYIGRGFLTTGPPGSPCHLTLRVMPWGFTGQETLAGCRVTGNRNGGSREVLWLAAVPAALLALLCCCFCYREDVTSTLTGSSSGWESLPSFFFSPLGFVVLHSSPHMEYRVYIRFRFLYTFILFSSCFSLYFKIS